MTSNRRISFWKRVLTVILVLALCVPVNLQAAKVKLNKASIILEQKSAYTLKLTGTKKTVKWASSNKKVASVSSKGKVTAKKPGTATIAAKAGGKKYTCKITVPNAGYSLCKGNTLTIKKTGISGKLKWTSSKKSCVSVNQKGKVKALKAGSSLITAKRGKKVYRVLIRVQKAKLNATGKKLKRNEVYQLKVLNNKNKVKWTSKNKKIAKINQTGMVTGITPGRTIITAKVKQGTLSCTVQVSTKAHQHRYTVKTKQKATCGQKGILEYRCKSCGLHYKEYEYPLPHNFVKTVVKPTCMERGYTKYVCSNNKAHTYVTDYVKATGHSWDTGKVIREASSKKNGEKQYTCKVCGTVKSEPILWNEEKHTLQTDKAVYTEGEDILVTAQGTNSHWVGIYCESDDVGAVSPIYSYYVQDRSTNHQSGKSYIIQNQTSGGRSDVASLPAGKYKIILFKNSLKDVEDYLYITVKEIAGPRLSLDKTVYAPGEKVNVTARGSGEDWVGIYLKTDLPDISLEGGVKSIYWYYVAKDGHISGSTYAINKIGYYNSEREAYKNLPAGEYKAVLFEGSGYDIREEVEFRVEGNTQPMAPVSAEYNLDNQTDGLANGKVTVKLNAEDSSSSEIIMYWADENGPLDSYTSLAKYRVTGKTTVCHMYENTIIPEGATRLLVYTSNVFGVSEQYAEVKLPAGCNFSVGSEQPITEFQMVSDVHITDRTMAESDINYYNNQHFVGMLKDVAANSPNSQAIIINGDIADTGKEAEYLQMKRLMSQVAGIPPIYMSVGNHDLSDTNYDTQARLFIKYANTGTDTVYYDKTINNYHYIFMGSEKQGLRADLSEKQLKWLDTLLAEDTQNDPSKPVFVMLHQSLYNTVAGSFPGQNWDGAGTEGTAQAKELRAILKKYPQVMFFNGHSHWELNSEGCMYERDEELPNIFNTASVGYLWSSYDIITGEYITGSHGYTIKVYNDKVLVMGRDFENGKYIPSAVFVAENYK